jgi:hypothetical protein
LISTPDTSGAGHTVLAPSVSVPGQRVCCQPRANPGSAELPSTRCRDPIPSGAVPGAADHHDPVMTSYLSVATLAGRSPGQGERHDTRQRAGGRPGVVPAGRRKARLNRRLGQRTRGRLRRRL